MGVEAVEHVSAGVEVAGDVSPQGSAAGLSDSDGVDHMAELFERNILLRRRKELSGDGKKFTINQFGRGCIDAFLQ